jgi:hypothetical protein
MQKKVKYIEPHKWTAKPKFHFYASSVATWRTNQNVEELIKDMKAEKFPFRVWFVPLPDDAEYNIRMYEPDVEGKVCVGFYADEKDKTYV